MLIIATGMRVCLLFYANSVVAFPLVPSLGLRHTVQMMGTPGHPDAFPDAYNWNAKRTPITPIATAIHILLSFSCY
uniref:Putative secreted peptide n=1 Tax=Anopheles braziliensis TaxID=58242 RepID=A0A2M3ZUR6_9DIPT